MCICMLCYLVKLANVVLNIVVIVGRLSNQQVMKGILTEVRAGQLCCTVNAGLDMNGQALFYCSASSRDTTVIMVRFRFRDRTYL